MAAVAAGEPLARVDLAAVEARVEAMAYVRSAEVTRQWPDRLVVAVLSNPQKEPCLSPEDRVELLQAELKDLKHVEVRAFRGLVARLAVEVGARWILRGVRSEADLAVELPMALSNRLLGGQAIVETIFLPARPELAFISSRLVLACAGTL